MEIQKDDHSITHTWGAKVQLKRAHSGSAQKVSSCAVFFNSLILLNIYFLPFVQGKFLRQHSKSAAPLHPFNLNLFIINKLSGVQRRVQQGAKGCKGGAIEHPLRALHPDLNQPPSRVYPQMVQGCKAKKGIITVFLPGILLITWKKNTLFILNYFIVGLWVICKPVKGLSYSPLCLCQPFLVMWLTRQTKGRNQGAGFTAHNYKLCDKRLLRSPIFNPLGRSVSKKTAIKFRLTLFLGICSVLRCSPPRERNAFFPESSPPLLHINCSTAQNLFLLFGSSLVSQEKGGLGG